MNSRSFAFSDPGILVPKKGPGRIRQGLGIALIPFAEALLVIRSDLRQFFGRR